MIFNYIVGNTLNNEDGTYKLPKKSILIFGIASNIALLGYFKYTDFMIDNLNYWILTEDMANLNLALPLAVSFFTFQQISYLVDSYREETKEYNFLNYSLFVTFFPQLIAGPIVHHKEMMPQFANAKNKIKNYRNIAMGLFIFSIGLFKKVVIADTFAVWATAGFDTATTLNLFEAWATSLSYTFQLYFDFSGYTDMAIGIALLFNIKLPINFNSPYKATNIKDFWQRWHMTLSRFLKDYIYIPLGGNRSGELRTYNNIMATFIIGGIWHGAGWTFLFWGGLHGIALVIYRAWSKLGFKLWTWLAWLITFNFVNVAWVFFRAKEWDDVLKVLKGMLLNYEDAILAITDHKAISFFGNKQVMISGFLVDYSIAFVLPVLIIIFTLICIFSKNSNEFTFSFKPKVTSASMIVITFIFGIIFIDKNSEFLYFNF